MAGITNLTTAKLGGTMENKRRGRPKDPNKLVFYSVGLRNAEWEWLDLWLPGANRTEQLSEMMRRILKFWPNGPYEPPRCARCGRFLASEAAECSCKEKADC